MIFGALYLRSKNPEKLVHFLTAIFDAEVKHKEEKVIVLSWDSVVTHVIYDSDVLKASKKPYFSLKVEDSDRLKSLHQKIEFYCYREMLEDVIVTNDSDKLVFLDTDLRSWVVTLS